MAQPYSANTIRTKLGELSLEAKDERVSPEHKSLLSKSLAQDKRRGIPISRHSPPQPMASEDILGTNCLTDDHPEPELLATSVGKDIDGRLLPSSSTISLLSLNANTLGSASTQYSGFPHIIDRKNSHTGLGSRNSMTHLSHQRLQPYQKLTSQTEASSPAIPMVRTAGASFMSTPDSPSLDPTSLGGSPSRFWLGSQTPPKSLSNSYTNTKRSCLHLSQLHSSQNLQNHGIHVGAGSGARPGSRTFRGDDSPTLHPVQTPMEDLPMTPLYLSSEGDSYFVYTKSQAGGRYEADQTPKRELFHYDEGDSEEEAEAEGADNNER